MQERGTQLTEDIPRSNEWDPRDLPAPAVLLGSREDCFLGSSYLAPTMTGNQSKAVSPKSLPLVQQPGVGVGAGGGGALSRGQPVASWPRPLHDFQSLAGFLAEQAAVPVMRPRFPADETQPRQPKPGESNKETI